MKILLVDDHQMVAEALAQLLEKNYTGANIKYFTSKSEAMKFLSQNSDIDVLISDLNFGGKLEGLHIVNTARQMRPQIPILVLSMHSEIALIKKVFSQGANAYVLKNDPPQEIFCAINAIITGNQYTSSQVKNQKVDQTLPSLSARELEIANLVSQGDSSKKIAGQLGISSRTVDVHRQNIMKKLKVHNTAQLLAALKSYLP